MRLLIGVGLGLLLLAPSAFAQGSNAKMERKLKAELDRLETETHGLRTRRFDDPGWCVSVEADRMRTLKSDLESFEQTAQVYFTKESLIARTDMLVEMGRDLLDQWRTCAAAPPPPSAAPEEEEIPELPTEEPEGADQALATPVGKAPPRVRGVVVEPMGSVFAGPKDRSGRAVPWGPREVRDAVMRAAPDWVEAGLRAIRVTAVGADTVERAAQGQQVELSAELTACAVATLWESGSYPRLVPGAGFADGWGTVLPERLVEPVLDLLSSAAVRVVLVVGERSLSLSVPASGKQVFLELEGRALNPEGAEAMSRERAVALASFLATAPPCR